MVIDGVDVPLIKKPGTITGTAAMKVVATGGAQDGGQGGAGNTGAITADRSRAAVPRRLRRRDVYKATGCLVTGEVGAYNLLQMFGRAGWSTRRNGVR
ncbi:MULTISPECIES: hypothetical protein [unclassified Streptomyces]|uniref:hypothetical protein n=1 Tax=unclassified Streptomyces TaxID=2593676 RepID=UPI002E2A3320|nr:MULTISPECIES: hypothetical protein [unclassified Streptomyces]